MHVLYFHQHFSTPDGATGTRSYEMARRLVTRGHKVTMVSGSGNTSHTGLSGTFERGMRKGVVDGIQVVEFELPYSNSDSLLKRSQTFLKFSLRSVFLALTLRYDLLFATSTPLTAGIPGIVGSLVRSKPFVFEVRDLWPELPREMGVISNPVVLKALDVLEWLSYKTARGCIGLSPGIVDGIVRRGVSITQVAMIPNGCDFTMFEKKGKSRRPEGVEPSDFLAVFTGAHGVANGLDAVLDAAVELKSRGAKGIRIVFIGDGKLKPKLVARAQRERLNNCVFLDPVPKMDLIYFLRGADLGLMILANVSAFYYGTSPNKFFDYIAIGLPVLNNYPGWLAEKIEKEKCGLTVPPEDPISFADALEALAADRTLLGEMGRNARKLAEKEFNRDQLGERFVGFLEKWVHD